MKTKFEKISAIITKAGKAKLPQVFTYNTVKKWMRQITGDCKEKISKQFPEVPIRVSLYEQKGLEQFQAIIVFVLEDGPHFAVMSYTWNPTRTGEEYTMKKLNLKPRKETQND